MRLLLTSICHRKELSHCNISPGKYIVERERIRMSSEFEKFDGVYYASVWDEHRLEEFFFTFLAVTFIQRWKGSFVSEFG